MIVGALVLPPMISGMIEASATRRPRNPWTLGSYSYVRVGQYQRFAGAEGAVVGSCHFAGEHTSIDAQGYLEGAVESGERAAREVLAAVGARLTLR